MLNRKETGILIDLQNLSLSLYLIKTSPKILVQPLCLFSFVMIQTVKSKKDEYLVLWKLINNGKNIEYILWNIIVYLIIWLYDFQIMIWMLLNSSVGKHCIFVSHIHLTQMAIRSKLILIVLRLQVNINYMMR